jgi:hypothetical protein
VVRLAASVTSSHLLHYQSVLDALDMLLPLEIHKLLGVFFAFLDHLKHFKLVELYRF